MGSLRDDILAADDLPREIVETPEWEPAVPKVWVRGLTAAERDAYEQGLVASDPRRRGVDNPRAQMCVKIIVDDKGERVFTDKDVTALGAKSGAVLVRIWAKGRELSGMQSLAEREDEDPSQPDGSSSTS